MGTINIGDRQRGRLKSSSVIDCLPQRQAITDALETLYSPAFRQTVQHTVNPYGRGGASEKIVRVLQDHPLDGIIKKSFHNLGPAAALA